MGGGNEETHSAFNLGDSKLFNDGEKVNPQDFGGVQGDIDATDMKTYEMSSATDPINGTAIHPVTGDLVPVTLETRGDGTIYFGTENGIWTPANTQDVASSADPLQLLHDLFGFTPNSGE